MPGITGGNTISDSAQINTGVVTADDIATDAVDSAEIKASAVGTSEVANDSIINEDIKSDAAIADSKLAQITTAGKVSGAALTSLASIPAGAGVIPAANIPVTGLTYKCGTTTKNAADNDSGTVQNIAHGLGTTPKKVKITAFYTGATSNHFNISTTVYNGTTQASVSKKGGQTTNEINTSFDLDTGNIPASNYNRAVVTFNATNIILTWTETGNAAGTYTLLWEAEA